MLEQGAVVECSRCESASPDSERWCVECGQDLTPAAPSLPTPEARKAAARSASWLADHPEQAEKERRRREEEEAEARRRAGVRPVGAPRPAMASASIGDFKSPRLRALLASRWISFNVVVLAISLALAVWHLVLLQADPTFAVYDASVDRLFVSAVAALVVYLIGAVVFLFWFHRVYANLASLGATGMQHGTGWAVGGWFVPILNFFRPKQIAEQAWAGSDPHQLDHSPDVRLGHVPAFLHLWWVLWVVGTIGENTYARMPESSFEEGRLATAVLVGAEAAQLVAGILAIVFIRRLTARQEDRAEALRERAPA